MGQLGRAQAAGSRRCGLTLRSSGLPPAGHLGRGAASVIILSAAQAPCRRQPLSFNVRHRRNSLLEPHASSPPPFSFACPQPVAHLSSEIGLSRRTAAAGARRGLKTTSLPAPTQTAAAGARRETQPPRCRAFESASCSPTDSSPHLHRPSSGAVFRCALYSARWSLSSSLPRTPLPQAPETNEPRAIVMPEQCRPNHLSPLRGTRALPNRLLKFVPASTRFAG